MVDISFGIVIGPDYNKEWLENLCYSIVEMNWGPQDRYEILICGNVKGTHAPGVTAVYPFDESIKPGWITKKKNILVKNSQYENIVLTHDYYMFEDLWIDGFKKFNRENPDWKIMCNTVMTKEGTRSADWLVNQRYMDKAIEAFPHFAKELMSVAPGENGPRWVCGLPYHVGDLTHIQYVSGAYIVAKKDVLLECPLNETIGWGDAEDIIWSQDVVQHGFKFHFNPYCFTFIQKPNKWHLHQMTDECVECLRELFGRNDVILPEIISLRKDKI